MCPFFYGVWIKSSSVSELWQQKLYLGSCILCQAILIVFVINNMWSLVTLKVRTVLISLLFKSISVEKWEGLNVLLTLNSELKVGYSMDLWIEFNTWIYPGFFFKISITIRRKCFPNSVLYYINTLCSRNIKLSK